ncbi:MAG: SDR family oxidoreductase [Candidatus Pacebacteria bacterium]|nr:SDR family oxidoreductase [Candidatus Paceibacterota bacterium]
MTLPFCVDLEGKTAVVTGGSGVLCGRMAVGLAACGANVAVLGRSHETTDPVVEEIKADGGRALAVPCNVLDKQSMLDGYRAIKHAFGPCDILINGAGGNNPKATTSMEMLTANDLEAEECEADVTTFYGLDVEAVQTVFGINFIGTFLSSQVFSPDMVAQGRGTIINISSMSGVRPLTKVSAYSAAKAATANFTQWLAVHLAKAGVRVNAIAPGFFLTKQNKSLLMTADGGITERGETIVSHTPLGRFGEPEELLGTLLWLVSPEASGFVTGSVIPVDGGFSAFSGV